MQLLKGAAMKAVWGFSFDFVPREYELGEDVMAKLAKLLRDLAPVENGRS
jgi:hypothetical protein